MNDRINLIDLLPLPTDQFVLLKQLSVSSTTGTDLVCDGQVPLDATGFKADNLVFIKYQSLPIC